VEPGERAEVRDLRARLDPSIGARVTNGAELVRAIARRRRETTLATTVEPLDALLGGGLARGKTTEIAGRGERYSIVMAVLAAATSLGEAAALIDLGDHFDPQLGEAAGIDLRRMLWVRPKTLKQAVMAAEMIGATGVQFVALECGGGGAAGRLTPAATRRVPDATWVRLARVAEGHGCTILVSAPYPLTGTTSEAMVLSYGSRARWLGSGRSPRVLAGVETRLRLEKHRHKRTGESVSVFFETSEQRAASSEQRIDGSGSCLLLATTCSL
jgi:hypothetical protein